MFGHVKSRSVYLHKFLSEFQMHGNSVTGIISILDVQNLALHCNFHLFLLCRILSPQPGPSGVKNSKKRKISSADDESDSKRTGKHKKHKKKKKKHKKSKKVVNSDDSDNESDSDEEGSLSPGNTFV